MSIRSNPSCISLANETLLNLLGAYDLIHQKHSLTLEKERYANKLLVEANKLSYWIVRTNSDEKISTKASINMLQTIRRERPFREEEKEQIKDMIDDKASGNDEKFALYLLLDDQKHAQKLFENLTVKEQEFYRTMPIFYFAHLQKLEKAE